MLIVLSDLGEKSLGAFAGKSFVQSVLGKDFYPLF